jgi:hypothetical protein
VLKKNDPLTFEVLLDFWTKACQDQHRVNTPEPANDMTMGSE